MHPVAASTHWTLAATEGEQEGGRDEMGRRKGGRYGTV